MSTRPRTLFLLDAMALAYRAYFAYISRPRINSRGLNTSSVYGFTTTLLHLINELHMEYAVVAFDGPERTFRSEIYPAYKATRDPPPDALIANLPLIRQVTSALGIPVMEVPGFEADDIIGTLACKAEADEQLAVIVSPDKDFQQLLSERITMQKPARGGGFEQRDMHAFASDYDGLRPMQFIDVLALMGDKSDNVPGAFGVGPKGAVKLVKTYGSVETMIANADLIRAKRAREALQNTPDVIRLSKDLVTIRTDVDVTLDWDACRRGDVAAPAVLALFRQLEFNTLVQRLEKEPGVTIAVRKPEESGEHRRHDPESANYRVVQTRDELLALERTLRTQEVLGLSSVMDEGSTVRASWVGMGLAWGTGNACYVPFPLAEGTPEADILCILAPTLVNRNQTKVGHGLKRLVVRLRLAGTRMQGPVFDTQVAHYLLSPDRSHSLIQVARDRLRYDPVAWVSVTGEGRKRRALIDIAPEELMVAACERAACPLQMRAGLESELDKDGLRQVADEMEFPLIYSLADMEAAGVLLDTAVLESIGPQLDAEADRLSTRIYAEAGRVFNINSPLQVGDVLYGGLKLPVRQKTATGRPSTKESVLEELAIEHPVPGYIIDYRRVTKLKSTYVDGLLEMVHMPTQRVHTVFNQTEAATGRLSSSYPGLQNIPVRGESGRALRSAFVAPHGWYLLSADYSQIELRILAHMSGDDALKEFFAAGRDPHTETAALIFQVPSDEVTRSQRNKAKAVNYGIPYGLSVRGLAQQLRCTMEEASRLLATHRNTFTGVTQFLFQQVERAKTNGYAETLSGRRRYLPDLYEKNKAVRSAAERIAVNMPIQGTQADMIKLAAVDIDQKVRHEGMRARAVLQVHDELVFEVPEYELAQISEIVHSSMTGALQLDIPVEVNMHSGANWLEIH